MEVKKRVLITYVVAVVCVFALFSACTAVVSHEREGLIRAADAGSTAARLLIAGSNFWARYLVFFVIMVVTGSVFGTRIAARLGRW
jgi:hypothetical protein